MLREGWTAAIEQYRSVSVFQAFQMGVAGDHNVHWGGKKLLQLRHRAEAALQTVHHADAPAVDVEDFDVLTASV